VRLRSVTVTFSDLAEPVDIALPAGGRPTKLIGVLDHGQILEQSTG
jgi:hypothetical protein